SRSRYVFKPESRKYSVTTCDPGARLALTQGFVVSPRSTAFFANRPAASITEGFEVFVQLVIAAITTEPCVSWPSPLPACNEEVPFPPGRDSKNDASAFSNDSFEERNGTRSCGRLGPAKLGSTVDRSNSNLSVNMGSGDEDVWNSPCS